MRLFSKLSIKHKLTLIMMLTSTIVVILSSIAFVASSLMSIRQSMLQQVSTLAEVLGANCTAALTFNDPGAAEENLAALRTVHSVVSAKVYRIDKSVFVQYLRQNPPHVCTLPRQVESMMDLPTDNGTPELTLWNAFILDHVDTYRPIVLNGEHIGTIQVRSDLTEFQTTIKRSLTALPPIILLFMLIALLLSALFQRAITSPILRLSDVMRKVSEDKDYEVRVHASSEDELGSLINGFNEMLTQIKERDARLEQHRDDLERQVELRTAELQQSNRELEHTISELHLAKDRAEAASRAKSQFLANMSHEIRTPMNGVLGMTEILMGSQLTDHQQQLAATVMQSGQSLLKILNDILDVSKIEAGKLELEHIPFSLLDCIEDSAQLLAEQACKKGLELICHMEPSAPNDVIGDPVRLRQIITNLLGNAIKFTDHGEVVLNGLLELEDEASTLLVFEISDTGIGIPEDRLRHIFDAFSQADESTTRRYGGTGLGLAICKQLSIMMGGGIEAHSEPDKGSSFRFRVRLNKQAGGTTVAGAFGGGLQGAHALIVDPNATHRRLTLDLAREWGMECDAVESDDLAAALIARGVTNGRPYDVIIIDAAILEGGKPGGFIAENTVQLRPETPFIVQAGVDSLGRLDQGPHSEFRAVVGKPVRRGQLHQALLDAVTASPPRKVEMAPPPAPEEKADGVYSGKILLAEDNPVNRMVAVSMLEGLGCEVHIAVDGLEAVTAFGSERYDLIFMDCQMPRMDGYEATGKIRDLERQSEPSLSSDPRDHSSAKIPIVALTAHALEGERDRCLAAGMDDYLSKPFSIDQLASILARWLPRR
ncbi:MAG: ATP-binding protein [Syntrophobacteraceae bacterium]